MTMKVVLMGPPHSGKSCLREGLKRAITRIDGAPYPFVITACPDGEGAWFQETALNNPQLARELKDAYKAKFTPEFAERVAQDVKRVSLPLTLIDIGGKVTPENRTICADATHAVILAGDMTKVAEWQDFCREMSLEIVAIIESDYHGTEDAIDSTEPILTGVVHHLERGEDNSNRPMVNALASHLVTLSNKPLEEKKMELTYKVNLNEEKYDNAHLLEIGFGAQSDNDRKVVDATSQLDEMIEAGRLKGRIALLDGPASLPVAVVIAHKIAHLYKAVAVFDPKMDSFIVSIAHGGEFVVGQVITKAELEPEPVRVENFSRHGFSVDQQNALRVMFGDNVDLGEANQVFFNDATDVATNVSGKTVALVCPADLLLEAQINGEIAVGTTLLFWRAAEDSRKRGNFAAVGLARFDLTETGWEKTIVEIDPTVEVSFRDGETFRYGGEPIETVVEEAEASEADAETSDENESSES